MAPLYVVLLGPPGVGKGTQAVYLEKRLGLPHVSTGEMFREHQEENTELGQLARKYLSRGELVPDEITVSMVRDYLARPAYRSGALLDGFPRTLSQAQALGEIVDELQGDLAVISIQAPENLLVERLSGRSVCRAHGHTYHMTFNPPRQEGICDQDGSELYQRDDDQEKTIARRITVYQRQTRPLIDYFLEQSKLTVVDGSGTIKQVASAISDLFPERLSNRSSGRETHGQL